MNNFRFLAGFLSILAVVFLFPDISRGQGNVSVSFSGTSSFGKFSGFDNYKAEKTVFPGVEARFGDKGRVSVGISYQQWELKRDPTRKSFPVFRQGQELLVSYDESAEAKGNVVFGTFYVNLVSHGKVRPFVGGGAGFGQFDVSSHIGNVVDVIPPFFAPGSLGTSSESQTKIMPKGVVGVNFYPTKNVVITLGGGYINGPAATFGIGFTF